MSSDLALDPSDIIAESGGFKPRKALTEMREWRKVLAIFYLDLGK